MSFHLITGLMGGGKSYMAVEMCLQAAKEGAVVHTNLPLEQEAWEALGLWEKIVRLPKDPQNWIRFEKGKDADGYDTEVPTSDVITGGAEGAENLVVFDEASIVFRTKDQAKNKDKHQPVFDLVALSRHVGLEIVFIAQHEDNVSADLRRLAQLRTRCVKARSLPLIGFIAAPLFGDFVRGVYKGASRMVEYRTWHRFSAKIGSLYRTHGEAKSVGLRLDATRKTKATDTSTKKGILTFVVLPLILLGLLGWMGYRIKQQFFGEKKAKKTETAKTPAPAPLKEAGKSEPRRGGWRLMEWDAQDELVFAMQLTTKQGAVVYTREGYKLQVGGEYMGEMIFEHVKHAGWHYFRTQHERLICVRPLQPAERAALPPVTIQGQPPPDQVLQTDNRSALNRAIDGTLGFVGGNQP